MSEGRLACAIVSSRDRCQQEQQEASIHLEPQDVMAGSEPRCAAALIGQRRPRIQERCLAQGLTVCRVQNEVEVPDEAGALHHLT